MMLIFFGDLVWNLKLRVRDSRIKLDIAKGGGCAPGKARDSPERNWKSGTESSSEIEHFQNSFERILKNR